MGVGSIVAGLAAIIIGEGIISGKFPFWARLMSVALGSVIYRIIFLVESATELSSAIFSSFTELLSAFPPEPVFLDLRAVLKKER